LTFQFRPAVRENVSLLIGLAGGTGSGKTFSAFRLAAGIAGDKPFAVIDTEAGRALHYADRFRFDHAELRPPFRPQAYSEAIKAADEAGYPVIVVDSFSHEHSGEGGLLEWHEEELQRMAGDDWKRREAVKMAAWIKPKGAHKAMVQRLLQVRAHLILCFRAEEKVDMVRGDDGKMKIVPKVSRTGRDGWVPICEKALPFELTASFLLLPDAPGVPQPIKLQEQHKAAFPAGKPIDETSGQALAAWAKGGKAASAPQTATSAAPATPTSDSGFPGDVPSPGTTARKTPRQIIEEIEKVPDGAALDAILAREADALTRLHDAKPAAYDAVMDAANLRRDDLRG
jgi:hypothetical protein